LVNRDVADFRRWVRVGLIELRFYYEEHEESLTTKGTKKHEKGKLSNDLDILNEMNPVSLGFG
jgi:hypothetical protein